MSARTPRLTVTTVLVWLATAPSGAAQSVRVEARAADSSRTTDSIRTTRRLPRGQRVPSSFRLQPYGSNANFNPFSMLVNRGLDMWQLDQYSPSVVDFPYAQSAGSVWRALSHPRETIDRMGFWNWVESEILPIEFDGTGTGWVPNYALHFFMGGVTYVRTEGWFADRGWPAPKLWAGTTVMAAAYLTEMTEVGFDSASASTFADLVFFDLTGVLVFNIPWVRELFGEKVRVMDWSLQPVFTPRGEVYNQGDYLAIKVGAPFAEDIDLIWRLGLGSWFGLSFPRGQDDAVSIAVGAQTTSKRVERGTLEESITVGFAGGVFYDRNGSLLGALEWGWRERLLSLNVYPGVLPGPLRDMGLWLSLDTDMRPRLGIVARPFGMGFGLSPQGPSQYETLR